MMAYSDARIRGTDALWDALKKVYAYCGGEKFIFAFDEWDYIFHQEFVTNEDKKAFTLYS